ncbi:septum formation protein [Arthrobacter pigmenti]|uniref:Nucleoside triphosphate pyrophosphatase n=1 Tax=Arthrobacter pigmenti TaxID=271432 RepID=A0A846RRW6_9MICC|nr:nucleoside triphosphate pyrophosphatase [Arthrobacter pigmenti]NJC21806.1 septum formation protein [Arthrobacter pigmenti]
MTVRLILASASPARTKLLAEAGIAHSVRVSDVDEDRVTAEHGNPSPYDTAQLLARAKAEAVAALPEAHGALILGCDSVFEFEGEAHGKPYEPEVARARIRRMSGSHGTLHTGHWLVDTRDANDAGSGTGVGAVASAQVHFVELQDAEIEAYIATGEPLNCAGSFTIDGRGGAFIQKVDGDPHAVVGLSVSTLRELLRKAGVELTSLWN